MIDNGVFEKLHEITSTIDVINEEVVNDFGPVIEFFSSNFATQALQAWSYYAQVNNHQKFTDSTVKLTKALVVLNKDSSTLELGSTLIRDILNNYIKVLYRGINNMKPSITNPILRLIKEFVTFNDGQYIDDFLTLFDLSLPTLPKILTPAKAELADQELARKNSRISMRSNFIALWLALIKHSTPLLRKGVLIDNYKIMSTWYKYMNKVDNSKLLGDTLEVFTDFVLKEKAFRKTTKCKVLNEALISKIHNLYHCNEKELIKKADDFFQVYATDPEYSVAFIDDKLWFNEPVYSADGSSTRNVGAVVLVNNKKFYLYNKLLFTVITFFKPWEDDMQLNTVAKILSHVPELVPPYCNYLATLGNHDPRMTSYWFGMTLLLGRIINLPIPERMMSVQTDLVPSVSLVMETIFPASISKSSLTRGLQNDIPLITQLTCQLMVFSFKKFRKVLELYDEKGWESSKSIISNAFRSRIPDLPIITNTIKDTFTKHHDNKILSLSLTIILRQYSEAFPNFFNVVLPTPNIYREIMEAASIGGTDLLILDNFLQFQEMNNNQTKWWHAAKDENSLFTLLLKLTSSRNVSYIVIKKVNDLLENLLKFNVVFDFENLLVSPILALITSLQSVSTEIDIDSPQKLKIWKLLDETIARIIKTPYKYVDLANKYGNISPFLVALSEQWAFVEKTSPFDIVLKWLLMYLRITVFTGESTLGIQKLAQGLESVPTQMVDVYLGFDCYEKMLPEMRKKEYFLIENVDFSFFQYITLVPVEELKSMIRYPVNELDAMALLYRIKFLLNEDTSLEDKQLSTLFDDMLSKAANYALSNQSFLGTFTSKNCFTLISVTENMDLTNKKRCQKLAYLTNGIIQIFYQIGTNVFEFQQYILGLFKSCYSEWKEQPELSALFVNSFHLLDGSQLLEVLNSDFIDDDDAVIEILKELDQKRHHLDSHLFKKLLSRNSSTIAKALANFVDENFAETLLDDNFTLQLIRSPNNMPILEQLLKLNTFYDTLIPFLHEIVDDDIILLVGAYMKKGSREETSSFLQKAVDLGYSKLKTSKGLEFKLIMNIFLNCHYLLSNEKKAIILEFIATKYEQKYIAPIAKFISLFSNFDDKNISIWMNKSILFVTKSFSECMTMSPSFSEFLHEFCSTILKTEIWSLASVKNLHTQIEVIVGSKWICNKEVLTYLNLLMLSCPKKHANSNRILQMLVNNKNICYSRNMSDESINFLTASLIFNIFELDPANSSNLAIQEKILSFYQGTISSADKLLLSILDKIESRTSSPWTNQILSWDFIDDINDEEVGNHENPKLIVKEKGGLVIVLSRKMLEQTASHYYLGIPGVPEFNRREIGDSWQNLLNFDQKITLVTNGASRNYYDPLFVLLLIIHNDELLRQKIDESGNTSYEFDMKKIVDTGILQFILMALSDDGEASQVALQLIHKMISSLDGNNQFRDGKIFKIFLTKIAYTFERLDENGNKQSLDDVCPITWRTISRLSSCLRQPTSPMYEIAYRWVLSFPSIRPYEIPLLNSILSLNHSKDNEGYYRKLHWVLESIFEGLQTKKDIELLKTKNFFEWLMNLLNSPYLSFKLRNMICSIIYRVQRIETGGSTLITRYAAISFMESHQQESLHKLVELQADSTTNLKNKIRLKQILTLRQSELNGEELALGYSTIISSQKRLREWMDSDEDNFTKRVCYM